MEAISKWDGIMHKLTVLSDSAKYVADKKATV